MKRIIIFFILLLVIGYFFDFGFIKGEITAYTLICDKENYINYQCKTKWLPLNPTTYKPNYNKQQVLHWTLNDIETLTKCSVADRKNWTCKYNDESAEFGFKNGQFWEISLGKNIYGVESVSDDLTVERYVPKFIYRLEELKWQ